jgi:uncharacterized protein YndB with AHSA1/START domain
LLVCRHQALVPAPVRSVWDLVGQPNRHPEWWPGVVEVQGKHFGHGCEYCHVARDGDELSETTFLVERIEELKELLVRCAETGLYMRWRLTEARDGTFVDAEFGINPAKAAEHDPAFDPVASQNQLRSWLQSSLDGLSEAAAQQAPHEAASGLPSLDSADA